MSELQFVKKTRFDSFDEIHDAMNQIRKILNILDVTSVTNIDSWRDFFVKPLKDKLIESRYPVNI